MDEPVSHNANVLIKLRKVNEVALFEPAEGDLQRGRRWRNSSKTTAGRPVEAAPEGAELGQLRGETS
jgi:hypothetical protein